MATTKTDPTVADAVAKMQALAEHCAVFEVPDLAAVSLTCGQVLAQIWNEDPGALATALMTWADTLTEVRCEVWYPDRDDNDPHLDVHGELSDGTPINVYGRLQCSAPAVFGPDLKPGDRIPINLDHLASLTRLGVAA